MNIDFYCSQCEKCLFCEKDVQIDMNVTMNICSYYYLTLDNTIYDSILVPDWKYDKNRFFDLNYLDKCPFGRFVNSVNFIKNVDSILPKEVYNND